MEKINVYQFQQTIAQRQHVSVAWLQQDFRLPYSQARKCLQWLQDAGWVGETEGGTQFPVLRENLQLRYMRRDEVDVLIRRYSRDCSNVFAAIMKSNGCGATLEEIEHFVRDPKDTAVALSFLLGQKMIFYYRQRFYSCISRKSVEILASMLFDRRHLDRAPRSKLTESQMEELRQCMEPLFVTEETEE